MTAMGPHYKPGLGSLRSVRALRPGPADLDRLIHPAQLVRAGGVPSGAQCRLRARMMAATACSWTRAALAAAAYFAAKLAGAAIAAGVIRMLYPRIEPADAAAVVMPHPS